jgi:methyltransferase-like protein
VRGATDPRERVVQSRGLMKLLAEAGRQDEIYGFLLRDQFERVKNLPDEVFIHDDLDEGSTAFFLYQVVEAAAREGLQYLADAEFPDPREYNCSPQIAGMLAQIPQDDIVTREQYFDFVDGRAFRKGLFCHHDVALQRTVAPQSVRDYYLTTSVAPAIEEIDPSDRAVVEFKSALGAVLRTDHRMSKAAIVTLAQAQPQAIAFADLVERARTLLGGAAPDLDGEMEAMTNVLFQAFRAGLVQLRREPARLTTAISERPQASPYARWQARTGPLVTNLVHSSVMLDDEVARRFVSLLDGTRDLKQLGVDLGAVAAADPKNAEILKRAGADPREAVQDNLKRLAKCALLVA